MNAGRELDALVAEKVMGLTVEWRDENHDYERWPFVVPNNVYVRRYSTDIAAAWPIVEKLRLLVIPVQPGRWSAAHGTKEVGVKLAHDPDKTDGGIISGEVVYWSTADTAPHAICLAALAAVGAEVPA